MMLRDLRDISILSHLIAGIFGQVTLTFRYGREDEEVMGLKFCNEAIMCLAQLYPPHERAPVEPNTPLQIMLYLIENTIVAFNYYGRLIRIDRIIFNELEDEKGREESGRECERVKEKEREK
ncbi:hypothetical protein O3M35_013246 [Rhynocoris fuscipes]|uniref:Uncharacterized protein n=1 Tax=Rhynocoris fuscipes TaxID=488301 RepID=A0AAW1CGS2_9HEMI